MPMFYFDVYDGRSALRDDDGLQLDDGLEAADHAAALLPELARDVLPGTSSRNFAVFVRNEADEREHRAALLFRAQSARDNIQNSDRCLGIVDLASQLSSTRQRALSISAKVQATVIDLMNIMEEAKSNLAEMHALTHKQKC